MGKFFTMCLKSLPKEWNCNFIYEWVNQTMKNNYCKCCENWNDFLYLTTNKQILIEVNTPKLHSRKENYKRCRCENYLNKFLNNSEIIVEKFLNHKLCRFSCLAKNLVKEQNVKLYDNLRNIIFIDEGIYAGSTEPQPIMENEIPLSVNSCPLMMAIRYCYQVRSVLDSKMEIFEDVVKSFDDGEAEVFDETFPTISMNNLVTSTPKRMDSITVNYTID
ncbi:hypothetical protein SNEBB_001415 [Seison nebaliae]|nr:hypothetical protein SNEBB_001415 [Seison nebaliae]